MAQKKLKFNFNKINYAIKKTNWPGRIEILNYYNKTIILDGSHNIDGVKILIKFLKSKNFKPVVLFGMLNNKKIEIFLSVIKNQIKSLLAIKIPFEKNAFLPEEITQICDKLKIKNSKINNIGDFLKLIKHSNQKVFLVTGSLYLVGKIRKKFL